MADIRIAGVPFWNASGYSVTEDSTPIDPSDNSGGYGQFQFTIPERPGSKSLGNKIVDLEDGTQGTTQGVSRNVTSNGADVTVIADSRLSALAVERTAQPYVGTLSGAYLYYFGLVGVTARIIVDSTVANRPVSFPGWVGLVWDQIKKLGVASGCEVSLVSDYIIVRPVRGRVAVNHRNSARSWSIDSTSVAQTVEALYYVGEQTTALAYPLAGWTSDTQVFQVDAGETVEHDIPLGPEMGAAGFGVSLSSVDQPVAKDFVGRYDVSSSAYSVVGTGDYPITAAEWTAGGGKIVASVGADTQSIHLVITGPNGVNNAPYQIAASSNEEDYSSLRIVGSGVFFEKKKLTLPTGRTPDEAPQVVGFTVDNEFFTTEQQAYTALMWANARWAGPKQTITVTTTGINRVGDRGSYRYPTVQEFNTEYAGWTIAQFNAAYAGKTFADFNTDQLDKVSHDFDNQAFGNVAGARVLDDDQWFRIRTATIAPGVINYTAEGDTTIADFNTRFAGWTVAQFNAVWAGRSFADFNTAPLRQTLGL